MYEGDDIQAWFSWVELHSSNFEDVCGRVRVECAGEFPRTLRALLYV